MLKSYFIIALRSLISQRLYSAINILGLAIGLAACILVWLFVSSETGYDKYHKNADNIARLVVDLHPPGSTVQKFASSQYKNGDFFSREFAQIEEYTRLRNISTALGTSGNMFNEDRFFVADPNFFTFFDFEFIHGGANGALERPNTLVLTESSAMRYFGKTNVIGKTLTTEDGVLLEVTAVVKDLPYHTHMDINVLASFATTGELLNYSGWEENPSFNYYTYLKLSPGTDINALQAKFASFIDSKIREGLSDVVTFKLQKVTDIYLTSKLSFEMKANGDINLVYAFSTIAVLILLIACINFMNLSTARATKRAKEVGVRKVMGAYKEHLVMQFIGEALMLALIAMVLACALVEATLPMFNQFVGKSLAFNYLSDMGVVLSLLGLAVMVGVVSGSYPAFYLSAFSPAKVLKGEVTRGKSGAYLRKSLVIFQFSVAIMLMIATAISFSQLRYARNIDLGYDNKGIIVLDQLDTESAAQNRQVLKNKLLAHPDITKVASSSLFPTELLADSFALLHPQSNEVLQMPVVAVDYNYFDVFGIELVAGRVFAEAFSADIFTMPNDEQPIVEAGVVINQAALKVLGLNEQNAVGQQFKIPFDEDNKKMVITTIIGVVKDHYFSSLHKQIKPTYHLYQPGRFANMAIKYKGNVAEVNEFIQQVWQQTLPNQPIQLLHMEDEFNALYADEDRQMVIFNLFSALAIFIACLGLFGLASFTTERRTKEVGIRKVIGASVLDIVLLLSKEFSKLVLLANIIAWPVAWYAMSLWLENFVYRVDLNPLVFIFSALIAFAIAWVTVGSLAWFAAQARPIKSLRYE